MAKTATKKPPTKTEVYASISEIDRRAQEGCRRRVRCAGRRDLQGRSARRARSAFTLPGLCKIVVQHKPAQAAKKGVPNPFKPGELMDVAAKPAKNVVKVRALKKLKDMV